MQRQQLLLNAFEVDGSGAKGMLRPKESESHQYWDQVIQAFEVKMWMN